jgi:hypothetical protein
MDWFSGAGPDESSDSHHPDGLRGTVALVRINGLVSVLRFEEPVFLVRIDGLVSLLRLKIGCVHVRLPG